MCSNPVYSFEMNKTTTTVNAQGYLNDSTQCRYAVIAAIDQVFINSLHNSAHHGVQHHLNS